MSIFKRISKNLRTSEKSKAKKRVRFVEDHDIDQVEMFENKDDLWFSTREECDFKDRDMKMGSLLQCMDIHELEIKTGECPRGLEHSNKEFYEAMLKRRQRSVHAVVATQVLFARLGHDDREAIAKSYKLVSESAKQCALKRAEIDEKFVVDHVRVFEPANRVFEKRRSRPSVMGRQTARRSLAAV